MLIFTQPIPRPALWGGTLLREYFRYPEFPDGIGQSWAFSAQEGEGGSNRVMGGDYDGQTLASLWRERPELFGSIFSRFPVIVSLVAPMDDLSLQIHPNDRVAAEAGFPTGKNEAWYFLETQENASIIYGQSAKSEAELRGMIARDAWDALMLHLPVKQGDFVYLPAGIVHALQKGSIVYEIQQATDVTYRFFDYHRKDAQGSERPLQLQQAIRCVDFSLSQADAHPLATRVEMPNAVVTTLINSGSFCVRRYEFTGAITLTFPAYALMTCVAGEGTADGVAVSLGKSFIVTAGSSVPFEGTMQLMCTCEGDASHASEGVSSDGTVEKGRIY